MKIYHKDTKQLIFEGEKEDLSKVDFLNIYSITSPCQSFFILSVCALYVHITSCSF